MEPRPSDPGAILDALRDRAEWDEDRRAEALDELISRFEPDELAGALIPRLESLGGPDGEVLIALVEGLSRSDLFDALADALESQPALPPDRLWLALEALEGSGRIEARPALVELRDELDDLLSGDDPLADLAAQIEGDPDSIPLAIAALEGIEPELRSEILAELAEGEPSPALLGFFDGLASADDADLRSSAERFLQDLRTRAGAPAAPGSAIVRADGTPRVLLSRIGPLDGEGRAGLAFLVRDPSGYRVSRFRCDVRRGLIGAETTHRDEESEALSDWDEATRDLGGDATMPEAEGVSLAALRLVAASAWLSGDRLDESARRVLAETFGPSFAPGPIASDVPPAGDPAALIGEAEAAEDARLVLDLCPGWLDDSELVHRLAVERSYRDPEEPPDPGAYRVLFEERLLERIDLYREMLLWSALVWRGEGRTEEAAAASRLAAQLGDPQNDVPGHPFLAEFMRRSVEAMRPAPEVDATPPE